MLIKFDCALPRKISVYNLRLDEWEWNGNANRNANEMEWMRAGSGQISIEQLQRDDCLGTDLFPSSSIFRDSTKPQLNANLSFDFSSKFRACLPALIYIDSKRQQLLHGWAEIRMNGGAIFRLWAKILPQVYIFRGFNCTASLNAAAIEDYYTRTTVSSSAEIPNPENLFLFSIWNIV